MSPSLGFLPSDLSRQTLLLGDARRLTKTSDAFLQVLPLPNSTASLNPFEGFDFENASPVISQS